MTTTKSRSRTHAPPFPLSRWGERGERGLEGLGGHTHAAAAHLSFPIPSGTPLAGYAARTEVATTTHDELQIAALVFEHAGDRLILVTADLIAVDTDLGHEVAAAANIDPGRLILAATHTHSGPAGIAKRLHPAQDEAIDTGLRQRFVAACATAIRTATAHLRPASLALGRANSTGITANRNNPDGPRDDRVTTLTVRDDHAAPLAVVVHFACHPTVLGAKSHAVSADLPGGMRRALMASFRGDAPVILFANGAAGDISTRYTRRSQDVAEVERLGGLLADAAARAMTASIPLTGPIRSATTTVSLPRKPDPGPDATAAAARLRAAAERILASDASDATKRQAVTRAQGAELGRSLSSATSVPETATLAAWSLGDLALVTLPGELFTSLAQEIEAASPYPTTLILGYANGHVGYLVDAAAVETATYEALASPYSAATGRAIVRQASRMLQTLHRHDDG